MLLVSDSKEDEGLFREALAETGLRNKCVSVESVREAVRALKAQSPTGAGAGDVALLADFIVVDMEGPEADPTELLFWIQNNGKYRVLPTVILTSAHTSAEPVRAYSLGANAVVAKPHSREELFKTYKNILEFWSSCIVPVSEAA